MKKWIIGGVASVLLLLAVPVVVVGIAFLGNVPLEAGHTYADGRIVTVKDGYVACFLVEAGGGRYVLVDGCKDPEASAVREALADRGAALSDIEAILLTHGHGDHVGAAQALPGVPVMALAAEIPLLEGERAYRGPMPRLLGATDTGIRAEPLVDGAMLQLGQARFEVFAVPGHTPGSAAFLVHEVLLVGDSAGWKARGELVGAPRVFTDDPAQNMASLRGLADRLAPREDDVLWIAPAHTGPAPGLRPLQRL